MNGIVFISQLYKKITSNIVNFIDKTTSFFGVSIGKLYLTLKDIVDIKSSFKTAVFMLNIALWTYLYSNIFYNILDNTLIFCVMTIVIMIHYIFRR